MSESSDSEQEYPDELLSASRIEGSRHYAPSQFVLEGLEALLFEMGVFEETGDAYNMSRVREYGDYIGTMSQEELFHEMNNHPHSTISSAAKQINPEYKPRTESTFEFVQSLSQEIAPRLLAVK